MKLILSILIGFPIFALAATAQTTSVYTSTKTSSCRTIESSSNDAGSYLGECRGVGGYRVQLLEGDIRQTLNIITPARKKFDLNFWGIFSGFSAVGEKIEWRTKAGVPFALIVRYDVASSDDPAKSTSYLMVVRIKRNSACVTDVVMPGASQNEVARKFADLSAVKPCKARPQ